MKFLLLVSLCLLATGRIDCNSSPIQLRFYIGSEIAYEGSTENDLMSEVTYNDMRFGNSGVNFTLVPPNWGAAVEDKNSTELITLFKNHDSTPGQIDIFLVENGPDAPESYLKTCNGIIFNLTWYLDVSSTYFTGAGIAMALGAQEDQAFESGFVCTALYTGACMEKRDQFSNPDVDFIRRAGTPSGDASHNNAGLIEATLSQTMSMSACPAPTNPPAPVSCGSPNTIPRLVRMTPRRGRFASSYRRCRSLCVSPCMYWSFKPKAVQRCRFYRISLSKNANRNSGPTSC